MIHRGGGITVAAVLLSVALAGCGLSEQRVTFDPRMAYIDARTVLRQAADHADPVVRANTMEAISQTLGAEDGAILIQGLSDPYPSVRFAAAMAVGDLPLEAARDKLRAMAEPVQADKEDQRAEPDKRVFCAVIYALHALGDTSHTGRLGWLLFDDEAEVRANAAMVMGKTDEPSAIVPLQNRLQQEQDPSIQLQLVEAMARLGDAKNAVRLEAYTKAPYIEDRLIAIAGLERIRAAGAVSVLQSLISDKQPPRVQVAAGSALARLGQPDARAYKLAMEAVKNPRQVMERAFKKSNRMVSDVEVSSLQCLAAISLGWTGRQEAVNELLPLLRSSDGAVAVSSAMSVVRLLATHKPIGDAPVPTATTEASPAEAPTRELEQTEVPFGDLYTAGSKD